MKNRIPFIDTAKGIGIILMVLGHIGLGSYAYSSIYSFHMPLFFFISGLLFSAPDKRKLVKRCKTILIPYFSLGLVYLAVDWIVSGFNPDTAYHLFWDNSYGLPIESALWFFNCFFGLSTHIFFARSFYKKSLFFSYCLMYYCNYFMLHHKDVRNISPFFYSGWNGRSIVFFIWQIYVPTRFL